MPSWQTLGRLQMFMDSTFYGCFVMLFTVSTVVLSKRYHTLKIQSKRTGEDSVRGQRRELKFWLALGTIMLALTTVHWSFAWVTMMVPADDTRSRSIMGFMRFTFEILNVFFGDALILSRLWTIGNKKVAVVAIPLLCFVGFLACGIRLIVHEVRHLLLSLPGPKDIRWWILWMTILTTCVNLYSTVFIAWQAWSANRFRHKSTYQKISHILSIMVESASIYTVWMIIILITTIKDLSLWTILLPVSPALYGCTMMLISVRLGLGWALGLGGQAAAKPKSLVMQFARSVDSEVEEIGGCYQD